MVSGFTVTITNPAPSQYTIQFWGSDPEDNSPGMVHENLNGKHIKDFADYSKPVRSQLLTDGTLITANGRIAARTGQVSIYDGDQTHRITVQDNSATIIWSCGIGRFGEAEEADGETSDFVMQPNSVFWRLIYRQDPLPSGAPGQKVPGIVPLGEAFTDPPTQVNDYYDDPRLGHT